LSLAILLAELEVAADADTEAGERAIDALRARIATLGPAARATLAAELAARVREAEMLHAAALGESLLLTNDLEDWRTRPPLPGRDERIANLERALRDADAVVYEYDELLRELTQLTALLLTAERA